MFTIEQKNEQVGILAEKLSRATGLYLFDFNKLSVSNNIAFRRQMKQNGIDVKVAKNTLIARAFAQAGLQELPEKYLKGPSGICFAYGDAVAPGRLLKQILEKQENIKLKAAIIEGQLFDGSQLNLIASLPTREDLISGILSCLNAPISGIVGSINAVMRDVASLIEEVAKKQAA